MSKPDYSDIVYIPPGASQIWPGLDISGAPGSYTGYNLVVSCEQYERKSLTRPHEGEFIHFPMADLDEFKIIERDVLRVCERIEDVHKHGGKVLVHCTGGLNRSAVVVARWLIEYRGLMPREAVSLIRALRSQHALCNRAFERWVLGEVLPTAETSAFRLPEGGKDVLEGNSE